jgi:hypothetical protein
LPTGSPVRRLGKRSGSAALPFLSLRGAALFHNGTNISFFGNVWPVMTLCVSRRANLGHADPAYQASTMAPVSGNHEKLRHFVSSAMWNTGCFSHQHVAFAILGGERNQEDATCASLHPWTVGNTVRAGV